MRGSWLVRLSIVLLAAVGAIASCVSADEPICQCFDFDVSGRAVGNFDGTSATLKLEGAIGLPEYSLSAWMDIDALPIPKSTFGGEARLTRDWLSIALLAQPGESGVDLSVQGRVNPPSWLLFDGKPTFIGGLTALVKADLLKDVGASEITLSPFFTGVIPAGDTTVSPSVGIDMSLDSTTQLVTVSGSRLISTVNAGCVLIANTVHFDGLFDVFSSLVVAVTVPEWKLTLSGTLLPTAVGGFSYKVGVSYEWGDTYLLPNRTEKPESVCTGGVCF